MRDIYARKMVGWQVQGHKSREWAAAWMTDVCCRKGIEQQPGVLHSDNGSPGKGTTRFAPLQRFGVVPSFGRPSVSNDNPYSAALCKILKYRPEFPTTPFEGLQEARQWMEGFIRWYNHEPLHRANKLVTLAPSHAGEDTAIRTNREQLYQAARAMHTQRWSGKTSNWQPGKEVWLNPDKTNQNETNVSEAA